MSRAFVPAHARAPTLAMSIVPRAMTHDFPRIVTDGGVAGAPERRARGAIARASRRHLARASTATTTRATRDGEGETSASARGAMVASCLALAMTLAGVDGEAASAATARGEVLGPVAGTFRENLAREERMVVDEVMRDEQIGIDIIREGATPRERLDMFIEKETHANENPSSRSRSTAARRAPCVPREPRTPPRVQDSTTGTRADRREDVTFDVVDAWRVRVHRARRDGSNGVAR